MNSSSYEEGSSSASNQYTVNSSINEDENSSSTNESDSLYMIQELSYKPDVPQEFVPVKDSIFNSLFEGIKMYTNYAIMAGFDTRLSTQSRFGNGNDLIRKKYVICNRGSKDKKKYCDTLATGPVRRRENSTKIATGCTAKIIFECVYGTTYYKVLEFHELHNHPLVSVDDRCHLKKAKEMSYSEKEFIVRASTAKMGATTAYKLRATLRGGYQYMKPKIADYKNFRRGINRILWYKDAQIIVNKMNDRRDHYPNYSFEFARDGNVLSAMFWADEREKAYYNEFGDVISFDATFRTNKYQMIFVPFTAIDHHKKSVTVGAGLLSNETIESYCWLLKAFLKAHGKQPTIVLTDQDPAIKQAIQLVSGDLIKNTDFRKRFNKLVWDMYIKPDEFENKWELIINEFNLEDKRWFNDMFEFRNLWIPAYFNDIRMCGLMKTTSRSESMNSFFNTYSQTGNLLLNFMMNYDTAIQKQRNTQQELDRATKEASYIFRTPREIERHASKVQIKLPEEDIRCTCENFNRIGILCRHAFCILMKFGIKQIPEQYIVSRWRKDVISRHYHFGRHVSDSGDAETAKLVNEAYYNFESCLDILRADKEKLASFIQKIEIMHKELENDTSYGIMNKKTDVDMVSKLMNISVPKNIEILVPQIQRNKGSGKKKRLISATEKACENSNKQSRICSGCGERAPHNLRTCPIKKAVEQSAK
ncbi:hypothetical protein L2E82_37758 [Cichorium intybus]|uniref:Uncharacterized protein n=1 Tax=Cichorium intybus TaxID=13427 RepID=A0ACB9AGP8_CICIN|nr:hypothetical protein L2E82_37758 [Cichorium intybus]